MTPTSYDTELIHEFVNERIRSGRDGLLHILFIILKILGILLLVILGLLFLCLLAVLFVPIRYRGNGSYHSIKDFGVHLHIHWLLHAVSLRIAYKNGLRYAVKLFGFRIFGSESEEKDTESGRVREGTQAADSDELEFVNAQEKTEDDDLDTGELILRAEAASEKTDAALEKAEETARLLEEAVEETECAEGGGNVSSCEECRCISRCEGGRSVRGRRRNASGKE